MRSLDALTWAAVSWLASRSTTATFSFWFAVAVLVVGYFERPM